jgi:RND family efflux transporter MFP subunit
VRRSLRLGAVLALACALAGPAGAEELECLIEPKVTVSIGTPVEGIIDKMHVERGDVVKRGQVLLELESKVERAAVAMAKARATAEGAVARNQANLNLAERSLARNEELSERLVVSERELDEARSAKEIAQAGLREAREDRQLAELDLARSRAALELRSIRSPIDGVVMKLHFSEGEFADSRPIMDVAQIDPLHVEVFAPVRVLGRIRTGMTAEVVPEQPVGGSHEATVSVVDPVVDAASGTFGVRLELPNPDHSLPAGLRCQVRIRGLELPAAGVGAPGVRLAD